MFQTLVFNKPYGVLSQFTDEAGHPGLSHFIHQPGVYPAGRLDHDSEGLLLLTSDNRLKTRLTQPRFEHPKTYWAQVEGIPTPAALEQLAAGVVIQGQRTRPAGVRMLEDPDLPPRDPPIRFRAAIPTCWVALTLTEGRNRQVRRMTAAVGHPTLRLWRAAIGPLQLADLPPGAWRALTTAELQAVYRSVGLALPRG
ncbi:MAG: pseudouridine synthase [Candidatus Sericytochromatia bacterium]|nr:pseudouridine synthase [Candidatus Sericytochromatia bacterium]